MLVDNKLSIAIHLGKTESILFGSNKEIREQSTLKIICGENEVATKDNVKYLRVSLDKSLGGKTKPRDKLTVKKRLILNTIYLILFNTVT